jgi:hypothetical protein
MVLRTVDAEFHSSLFYDFTCCHNWNVSRSRPSWAYSQYQEEETNSLNCVDGYDQMLEPRKECLSLELSCVHACVVTCSGVL